MVLTNTSGLVQESGTHDSSPTSRQDCVEICQGPVRRPQDGRSKPRLNVQFLNTHLPSLRQGRVSLDVSGLPDRWKSRVSYDLNGTRDFWSNLMFPDSSCLSRMSLPVSQTFPFLLPDPFRTPSPSPLTPSVIPLLYSSLSASGVRVDPESVHTGGWGALGRKWTTRDRVRDVYPKTEGSRRRPARENGGVGTPLFSWKSVVEGHWDGNKLEGLYNSPFA